MPERDPEAQSASNWLVSPGFDLTLFFGGGALSLGLALLAVYGVLPIVVVFWVWLLAFDGPHMMAAFTRTYADRGAWQSRRRLLLGTLLAFLIGPACLVVDRLFETQAFTLFLGVATLYGLYHVIRQHYGFMALYAAKARQRDPLGYKIDRWALYVGAWLPYLAFVLGHPRARVLVGLSPDGAEPAIVWWITRVGFALALAALLYGHVRAARKSWPKLAYSVCCLLFYAAAYFWLAGYEPVYGASQGPDQDFLMLSVLLTLAHNVQYVALVYVHNRSRYRVKPEQPRGIAEDPHMVSEQGVEGTYRTDVVATPDAGAASWISHSALRYALICLSFAGVYAVLAAATGVYPGLQLFAGRSVWGISMNQLGLALWWGLAFHHYWLDQRIWRIKDDPALRVHLGLG